MVPSTWAPERDSGAKRVLGRTLPAGQSAPKDLDDVVATLMAHPNIAPFIAQRMIQHLVMSDPSPAYVGRVAAVFRDNGQGVAGDMKAVIKAVLLDADGSAARAWTSRVFPTTVLIDRSGRPRQQVVGAVDWDGDDARQWVRELLSSGATRT